MSYKVSAPLSHMLAWGIHLELTAFLFGCGPQLLQYKADINAVNEHGNVPLHYACFWGQDQVAEVSSGIGEKQLLSLRIFWNSTC